MLGRTLRLGVKVSSFSRVGFLTQPLLPTHVPSCCVNWPLTLKSHLYLKLALLLSIYCWGSEQGDYETRGSQESHNIEVTCVTSQYLYKVQKGKIHNQTGTTALTPNLTRRPLKSQRLKKKFMGILGHLSWVCTMEVGTVLVGTGLLGTWIASQSQIPYEYIIASQAMRRILRVDLQICGKWWPC